MHNIMTCVSSVYLPLRMRRCLTPARWKEFFSELFCMVDTSDWGMQRANFVHCQFSCRESGDWYDHHAMMISFQLSIGRWCQLPRHSTATTTAKHQKENHGWAASVLASGNLDQDWVIELMAFLQAMLRVMRSLYLAMILALFQCGPWQSS